LQELRKIPAFAQLVKALKHRVYRENVAKQEFEKEFSYHLKMSSKSPEEPVIPLIPDPLPSIKDDKTKWIQLDLKVKAGSASTAASYKKNIRIFDDGTPYQWILFRRELEEIWRQNTVTSASDRVALISAILKNESLTAFEVALEDVKKDEDTGTVATATTLEHVNAALAAVATTIFPHRALEIQKRWMNRGMKKPYDLPTRRTAAAIARLNNCLPIFPEGSEETKFSDDELVGLLEWSLPLKWRQKFDLDNFVPSKHTLEELISRCEAIERNEKSNKVTSKDDNKKLSAKKNRKFEKGGAGSEDKKNNGSYRREWGGLNRSHSKSSKSFSKHSAKNDASGKRADEKPKPFSKRTFRKEINAIARKAGKKKALDLYEAALKREKAKLARAEKKLAEKQSAEESESSDSEESVNVLEKPIPKKITKTAKNVQNTAEKGKKVAKNGKKVSFAEKLKRQRDRILEQDKAFLKKVKRIEKEENQAESSESDEEIEMMEENST
jgi:hypothetical protein